MNMVAIVPRIIRLRDAPGYLGMCKDYFNQEVRPCLTELQIGSKGVGFDRLELDLWVTYTKASSGRAPIRRILWETNVATSSQVLPAVTGFGGSGRASTEDDFAKAVTHAMSKRQKGT